MNILLIIGIKMEKNLISKNMDNQLFNAKSVLLTLESLMKNVTSKTCNAENVNAACNCAAQITEILKLHLENKRLTYKYDRKAIENE
jgi:hypothetical protein